MRFIRLSFWYLAIVLILGCSFSALAEPITYTISGTGSGSILPEDPFGIGPVTPFTNLAFSFTLQSDTSELIVGTIIPADSGSLVLGAMDSSLPPSGYFGLFGGGGTVSLYDASNPINSVVSLSSAEPDFVAFGLITDIGPVPVSAILNPDGREDALFLPTSFGTVVFSDVSDATFSASLATPEPAAYMLIGVGSLALWALRRSARG